MPRAIEHQRRCRPASAPRERIAALGAHRRFPRAAALLIGAVAAVAGGPIRLAAQERAAAGQNAAELPAEAEEGPARVDQRVEAPAALPRRDSRVPRTEPLPGEIGPPTFLLEDQNRELQPVLGFSYEDFMRLFHESQPATARIGRPSYAIDRLEIAGRESSQRAQLELELTLAVATPQWVRVPLRLSRTIVQEVHYDGPGEFHLQVHDSESGETSYVGWLRTGTADAVRDAAATTTVRLRLKLFAPLTLAGPETRLKLALPRATLSRIALELPGERVSYRVSEGSMALESGPAAGGATTLVVGGTGGDVEIAWRGVEAAPESEELVLEAAGTQLIRIDGRSIHTEARLAVRSFGREFDEFQIRLPAGAELVSSSQPGAQMNLVGDSAASAGSPRGKLVNIRLDKKSAGPVEMKLATERPHRLATDGRGDEPLDLAGFEVVGAVRQFGHIGVAVVGNWQISWGALQQISRTDDLPAALRRDDLTAGFEYYANPYSLIAEIAPQRTRMRVQPEHMYRVSAGVVELESRLRYNVRGSKVRRLELDLADWEIDEVGPASRVAIDGVPDRTAGPLTIPLMQELSGDFEIKILAHRAIAAGADSLTLEMPRPSVRSSPQSQLSVLPANVAIVPDENVELQPREIELRGLSRQPLRGEFRLPERHRDPLSYRCESGAGLFVAGFRVRPREIRVQINSLIAVQDADVIVDQTLDYQIANEPADKLVLDVPRAIPVDRLSVSVDGPAVGPMTPRIAATDDSSPNLRVEIPLPEPRLGRIQLSLKFPWRVERAAATSTVAVDIPLAMPAEGVVGQNQLLVTAGAGVQATARPGGWRPGDRSRGAALPVGSLALAASDRRFDAPLVLQFVERQLSGTMQIEQAWIQTRLTDSVRQDRAVYRIVSNDRQLRLTLPSEVVEKDTTFLLNNKVVQPLRPGGGEWTIPLGGAGVAQIYVLELRYRFRGRPAAGQVVLQAPSFADNIWQRHVYWQVIAPALEHLMWGPEGFTSESSWRWRGGVWRRQPALEQEDLEQLLGTASSAPPAAGANRYLFSTVGVASALEMRTVRRTSLVLFASLAVLSSALALIYWPVSRHPGFLIGAATVLIGLSLMNPEASLLVAQSASLGGLLGVVGYVLARIAFRRRQAWIGRGSSFAVDRGSGSQASQRLTRAIAPTTAATPLLQGSSRKQEL